MLETGQPLRLNEDVIQEDLRKGREKKKLDEEIRANFNDCDWNPLGLTEEEWMALSSDERIAAYKAYHGLPSEPCGTVHIGPRGGRYTYESTRGGRIYRRYF
jgi:hypothetical protein